MSSVAGPRENSALAQLHYTMISRSQLTECGTDMYGDTAHSEFWIFNDLVKTISFFSEDHKSIFEPQHIWDLAEFFGRLWIILEAKGLEHFDNFRIVFIVDVSKSILANHCPRQKDTIFGMFYNVFDKNVSLCRWNMFSHFEALHPIELLS